MNENILSKKQLAELPQADALAYLDEIANVLSFKQFARVLSWISEGN